MDFIVHREQKEFFKFKIGELMKRFIERVMMKQLSVKLREGTRRLCLAGGKEKKTKMPEMEAAKSLLWFNPFCNYQFPWTFYLPLRSWSQHEQTFIAFLGNEKRERKLIRWTSKLVSGFNQIENYATFEALLLPQKENFHSCKPAISVAQSHFAPLFLFVCLWNYF